MTAATPVQRTRRADHNFPIVGSMSRLMLEALLSGPGTMLQICERENIDIDAPGDAARRRAALDGLVNRGFAKQDRLTYSISQAARAVLQPSAPYVGQVATSRQPPGAMPVTIIKAPAQGARP